MHPAKYTKLALATLTLAIAACAPAPGLAPTTSPSPSPATSPGATVTPSTAAAPASVAPAATDAATAASPSPAGPVPLGPGKPVTLSGVVYDESGAPLTGANVTVNSLDPSTPFSAKVVTTQGSYVVSNAPEGINLEIIATKPNWTVRRRVGAFQAGAGARNEVNFGSPLATSTDLGAAFFISRFPEVVKTAPVFEASNVDPTKVSYALTLSEPLDEINKRRFADAIRILPANRLASPSGTFTDLTDEQDTQTDYIPDYQVPATSAATAAVTVQWSYSIKAGSLFLGEPSTQATVSWDPTNTVATLSFNAPLITDKNDSAKYEVGLVWGDTPIVDQFNNQLGTDKLNSLHVVVPAAPATNTLKGTLIRHAFVPATLAMNGTPTTGELRWAATHQTVSTFSVTQVSTVPVLTGVNYSKNLGTDSRLELTFNEPMAAYNGTTLGRQDASLTTGSILDNLSLTVSDRQGGTARDTLNGPPNIPNTYGFTAGTTQLSNASQTWGASSGQVDSEFKLDRAAFTTTSHKQLTAPADTGKISIEVNPLNPNTVFLYFFNRPNIFASSMVEIRARVENVGDPAGNISKGVDANASIVSKTF